MILDMKSSLVVIFVLSFSLVGSFSNSYAEVGDFITNFDGLAGEGTEFINPFGVAVDSNERIIVAYVTRDIVQIFEGL